MQVRLALSLLAVASVAPGQTPAYISPVSAASGLGNSNNSIPFAWTPTGYQQVHSKTSFNNLTPAVITRLRLRMGNGFANSTGATIDVELFMAQSPNDAASASTTFANNVSGAEVNVVTRKMVNLPMVPDNSWAVAPFPFDNTFPFVGSHLSWRANVYGNSRGNAIFSYPLDAVQISGAASTRIGTGCSSATGTAAATHSVSTLGLGIGASSQYFGSSFVAAGGLPALLTIGTSNTSFLGIPLPFDLGPAGAPGCALYNNWIAVFVGATSPGTGGSVTINVPIPNDRSLVGTTHYSQFLFVEQAANALGVFTSNGAANVIGTGPEITRIYAVGSPGATSGTPGYQYGMAIGLN